MSDVVSAVRRKYGEVAQSGLSSRDAGVSAVAMAFGYDAGDLASIPAEANMGLSCGNPVAMAGLQPGETVVDLGSGGGLDVFLAAKKVGATGRAIGIDMTEAMIERAERAAREGGYENVSFYHAQIDRIPLADASVDVVISNCVINLAPDKAAVLREIARILRPGGRVAISDIALKQALPEALAASVSAYVGCIAGAVLISDYERMLTEAGFRAVEVVDSGADLNAYGLVESQSGCCSPAMGASAAEEAPLQGLRLAVAPCCGPVGADTSAGDAGPSAAFHAELGDLLRTHDVNTYAASVKIFAVR